MSNNTPNPAVTCREAAEVARYWQTQTPYKSQAELYRGMATVLEAFGDQPVPEALREEWGFNKPPHWA